MRTNIDLDEKLIREIIRKTKAKTKREAVHEALENYVKWLRQRELLDLKGKVIWEGNLAEMRKSKWSR